MRLIIAMVVCTAGFCAGFAVTRPQEVATEYPRPRKLTACNCRNEESHEVQLLESQESREKLKAQLLQSEEGQDSLEAQLLESQESREKLKAQLLQSEEGQESLEAQLLESQESREKLKAQLLESQKSQESLTVEAQAASARHSSQATLLQDLREQLAASNERTGALEERLGAALEAQDELAELELMNSVLETELTSRTEQVDWLQEQQREAENRCASLQHEKDDLLEQAGHLKDELVDLQNSWEAKADVAAATHLKQTESMQAQLSESKRSCESLATQFQALTERAQNLEAQLTKSQELARWNPWNLP